MSQQLKKRFTATALHPAIPGIGMRSNAAPVFYRNAGKAMLL
jgi:hypothetical protein